MITRILAGVGMAALIVAFPSTAWSQDISQNNAAFSFNELAVSTAVSSASLSQVISGPLTFNFPGSAMGSTVSTGNITSVTIGPNSGNTVTNLNTGIANQGAAISVSTIISTPDTTTSATSLGLGTTTISSQ